MSHLMLRLAWCVAAFASMISGESTKALTIEEAVAPVVATWMQEHNVSAAAVTVSRDDAAIWKMSFGGWDPDEPRQIASLSKAITAICIGTLVDGNRLELSSKVGQLMDSWFGRFGEPADARIKSATVAHLLAHRGGYDQKSDGTVGASLGEHLRAFSARESRLNELLQRALRVPMPFDPGDRYAYSNVHYFLLGAIVEQVTGKEYDRYCGDAVLRPLGIEGGSLHPIWRVRSASGGWSLSGPQFLKILRVMNADGGLLGPRSRSVLESSDGRWVDAGRRVYYGLGMFVQPLGGGAAKFWHSGSWTVSYVGTRDGNLSASIGSYAVRLAGGISWFATYSPNPRAPGAAGDLDRRLSAALQGIHVRWN